MENLKIHHLIIMVSLFVSLLGTLLFLEKMNENAVPITSQNTLIGELIEEYQDSANYYTNNTTDELVVRVVNETEESGE